MMSSSPEKIPKKIKDRPFPPFPMLPRIIPRLDIKGPNLVKGIHFEGLRVLGKPWDFAFKYYKEGADELLYMDAVASLYERNSLLDIVHATAKKIFIPFTVGGGIRTIEDIKKLLRAGADKVAMNTAAIRNPHFIREAAGIFGSQCIVISIEAKMGPNGTYEAMTDYGRERSGKDALLWAKEATELGAGELLVTSVDREGTGIGFDLELIQKIAMSVSVPVIAAGGAGKAEHVLDALQRGRADAVAIASIFHYLEYQCDENEFQTEGNIEFLKQANSGRSFMKDRLSPIRIKDLKNFLKERI